MVGVPQEYRELWCPAGFLLDYYLEGQSLAAEYSNGS
jgi:hypothetical protein